MKSLKFFSQTLILAATAGISLAQQPTHRQQFDDAEVAWEMGKYPDALQAFIRLMEGPNAAAYFERIALITGELYHTYELTNDGAAPRVSPDGRYVGYESGDARAITIVDVRNGMKKVATISGSS